MKFKVEKNIPLPGRAGRMPKYPWKALEVGDSFLVPSEEVPKSGQGTISNCANAALGAGNFRTAKVDGGVRVWRLA